MTRQVNSLAYRDYLFYDCVIRCLWLFTENETEISYFRLDDYLAYKANPSTTW